MYNNNTASIKSKFFQNEVNINITYLIHMLYFSGMESIFSHYSFH